MSKAIMVSEKVFSMLNTYKKTISNRASFNTTIMEILRQHRYLGRDERFFSAEFEKSIVKRKIYDFITELKDFGVYPNLDELHFRDMVMMILSGDYQSLSDILHERFAADRFTKKYWDSVIEKKLDEKDVEEILNEKSKSKKIP